LLEFTGMRPESEACKLTIRDSKTGGSRAIPIHPEVEDDLRAIMEPRPTDPADLDSWQGLPIFRKRDGRKAMDRNSYQVPWHKAIKGARANHRELVRIPAHREHRFQSNLNARSEEPERGFRAS